MKLSAELHCHTNHSEHHPVRVEGINSAEEIMAHAHKLGIDVVAITDHDTIDAHKEAKKAAKKHDILFLPGEEITSADGDVLAYGISEQVAPGMTLEDTLDHVHRQGGVAVAPHPFDVYGAGMREKAKACDAIEVFNAINLDRISNARAKHFAKKHGKPMTAGSDAHCLPMMGHGLTHIKADVQGVDDAMRALRAGKMAPAPKLKYISVKVMRDWNVERVKRCYGETIAYMEKHYSMPKRLLAKRLMNWASNSPGKIDYVISGMAYAGIGGAMLYSGAKAVGGAVKGKVKKKKKASE